MQISVAPNSTASLTRRVNSSSECSYASGERRDCPNPQNAHPTTQTLETLMFRLTTNVTVSPASSARSSSAAARICSITSGRRSANSAVISSAVSARPSRPFMIARGATSSATVSSPRRPDPRRGMNDQKRALITSITGARDPLRIDVLRVHAQALGQRDPVRAKPLADLGRRRERVLRGDMVAVRAEPAEVGGAGADELCPPVRQVRRDLDADVGHQPARLGDEPLHVLDRHLGRPRRERRAAGPLHTPVPQYSRVAASAICAGSRP